ncbi:MAG: GxxExxY protein, partial [Parcubacteria group bacterium]
MSGDGIIYPILSYKITGLCFRVHRELGRFCRERQFVDRLEQLLKDDHLVYEREYDLRRLNPKASAGNRVDLYIDGKILLDAKAKKFITK